MDKVKLTEKQANSLESARFIYGGNSNVVKLHTEGKKWRYCGNPDILNNLDTDTVIKALYIGYDVIEEFKVGHWVEHKCETEQVMYRGEIDTLAFDDVIFNHLRKDLSVGRIRLHKDKVELMKKDDIEFETKRRKWAIIGRKVNEYKEGDIVNFLNESLEVDQQYVASIAIRNIGSVESFLVSEEEIELICPVEQRFDLKGE